MINLKRVAACLALGLLVSACQSSIEQPQITKYTIEQFMDTTSITGSSFSPDESEILVSSDATGVYNAYAIPVTGGEARPLTESSESVWVLSFFPNDRRILYLSDQGGNEIYHIHLRSEDGSTRDLTPYEGARSLFYDWSYDEQSFYLGSNRRDPKFMDIYEMQTETLQPQLVYENVGGYNFAAVSNDERYFAFSKTITEHNSDMYLYDRTTGELKHLSPHEGDINFEPQAFSHDSKSLFYLTNEGSEFSYLKQYGIASGESKSVAEADWDILYAYFSRSGRYRVLAINNDAQTQIRVRDTTTNQDLQLPDLPDADIRSVEISRSENLMSFYLNGSRAPNNLYVFDIATGEQRKLTDTLSPEIDSRELVDAEVVRYQALDGLQIPALLYKPHQANSQNKVPALVWVHGGPGGQSRIGYSDLMQYLVNHGYAVLAVNNRGSSGYGKTFFGMDDRKHGQADLDDCVAAKDYMASLDYVEGDKVGIIGGSYGGYMVLAGLAFRPDAFDVGVDIFGVSNWVRTLKSVPPWWEAFREALYRELGNPETDEEYLVSISPLFHAHKIRKPLIVLQGANDPRVLKAESDEIVEAVKKNGVPVEYLVFEDEGHGFVKTANQARGYKAILDFLERHLKH
ncbi:MAG: alpha/beta fold hydrolase [Acidobacteriota bacterium]